MRSSTQPAAAAERVIAPSANIVIALDFSGHGHGDRVVRSFYPISLLLHRHRESAAREERLRTQNTGPL
jgi:hypothetical protein